MVLPSVVFPSFFLSFSFCLSFAGPDVLVRRCWRHRGPDTLCLVVSLLVGLASMRKLADGMCQVHVGRPCLVVFFTTWRCSSDSVFCILT